MRTPTPLSITALIQAPQLHRDPLSIQDLALLTHGAADYPWFRELTTQYLPTHASTILSSPSRFDQFRRFLTSFEAEYFPLCEYIFPDPDIEEYFFDWAAPWSILRQGIPYHLAGFTDEDLHSLWEYSHSPALPATLLLCDLTDHYLIDNGVRLSWLDTASTFIPDHVLAQIPPQGFTRSHFSQALQNSPHHAMLSAVAWLFADTGNFFLDNYFDDYNYDGFGDPWDPDILAHATTLWQQAKTITTTANNFADWLHADLPTNFAILLQHLLDTSPSPEPSPGDPRP